ARDDQVTAIAKDLAVRSFRERDHLAHDVAVTGIACPIAHERSDRADHADAQNDEQRSDQRGHARADDSTHPSIIRAMTLSEQIQKDMVEAMRSKQELRLSVLRMMKSAVKNKEIDKRAPLDDKEVVQVLSTM